MALSISVIIPAFNAGDTLEETLDSVHAQSRNADEVIVINDGSDDDTQEIATKHQLDPVVINTARQGASAAINEGIKQSNGELLAFVDADDLWMRNKLELQECKLYKTPGTGLILTYMEAFICSSMAPATAQKLHFKNGPQPGFLLGTMLCHRHVFENYGDMDATLKTGYFIDWFDRIKTAGVGFHILPDVLMRRRIRSGTLSLRTPLQNGLSADFVEIARRSIVRKRRLDGNSN